MRGVTIEVRAGEIVGIAGVSGNGQSEMVEVLAGQRAATAGAMLVNGEDRTTRRGRRCCAITSRCCPRSRCSNACVARMSVSDNMAFRTLRPAALARTAAGCTPARSRWRRKELIARYRVKTSSPDAPIATLSGGNVQRAVLARELSGEVDVLIAANPVFGLDFAAVAEIHAPDRRGAQPRRRRAAGQRGPGRAAGAVGPRCW